MNWQTTVVILSLILSTIIASSLAFYAWRRRNIIWSKPFALLTAAIAVWSLGYAWEIGASDLATKTLWAQVQYIGIAALPVGWFLFAFSYAGRNEWLSRPRIIFLAVIPILTILLAFTNNSHHLLWAQISLNSNGPFVTFDAAYGLGWWLHFVYSYSLLLAGSIVLFIALLHFPTAYRWQLVLLLLSPLLPWLGNAMYITRVSPIPQLDLGAFAFAVSSLILGINIFQFHLFDIVPVARSTVIDSMREAMLVLDAQNRIVDLNPAAHRLFEQTGDGWIGQPAEKILSRWPDEVARYIDTIETQEEISLKIDDLYHYYNLQISPIYDRRQRLTGRLVLLRDVTRDKQAEEALALAQVKSEFLAKVGHELRTPLNGVLGLAEMLEFGIYGDVNEAQQQALEKIIGRTQHLIRLVDDLLHQTRLEGGSFSLEITDFTAADLLENLAETMRPAAKIKKLALAIEIAPNVPPTLRGDPTRIYQILLNLVDNALKFTTAGRIDVRVFSPNADHWAFSVADTGAGIPKALQEHIFNAFQQAHYSYTRREAGVGLGLSIVKQLTELMGGEITLLSQDGQGSTFTVILPLKPVIAEAV